MNMNPGSGVGYEINQNVSINRFVSRLINILYNILLNEFSCLFSFSHVVGTAYIAGLDTLGLVDILDMIKLVAVPVLHMVALDLVVLDTMINMRVGYVQRNLV
jgi:hypothetical protein